MWLPISVASEDERYVSTPVDHVRADEDEDESLLASMGILFFGTMR
jgi:hypothetical protein